MRASFLLSLTVLLVSSYGTMVSAQTSFSDVFTANLSLGSMGTPVILLQRVLNLDTDTQIANSGPGSPGYETSYFGPLTKAAVMRFQTKYTNEVLTPVGLTRGSGYVGTYTRAKLNALSAVTASAEKTNPPPVTAPAVTSPPITTTQNPNLENLDIFLTYLGDVAKEQGYSESGIATLKDATRREVLATTIDLRAAFIKLVTEQSEQSIQSSTITEKLAATVRGVFGKLFAPEHAEASSAAPFGGALLFSFYCACSSNWLITISPLPPTYVKIVSYTPFSQAFLSNNIPETKWLLGQYTPGAGVCLVPGTPCSGKPTEGLITPVVGSSPM